jgi:hypothetical protein
MTRSARLIWAYVLVFALLAVAMWFFATVLIEPTLTTSPRDAIGR